MAFVSFFDISAMAPIVSKRITIISTITGVEEFHMSFFVEVSSLSFCDIRMGAIERMIFVFFLISLGDDDDT